jgi:hypothetical protein
VVPSVCTQSQYFLQGVQLAIPITIQNSCILAM